MFDFLDALNKPLFTSGENVTEKVLLALLLAFVLGQLNAWFYKWTHKGVSYSRSFTQALVLISICAAVSMSLVATNVVAALGLLGGLSIIRFRTVVRDARDTSFVFLSLICGMAAGFGHYGLAIAGSVITNIVAWYLYATGFGTWHAHDSLLRFQIETSRFNVAEFEKVLMRFCRRYSTISIDEHPHASTDGVSVCQCAYKIRLRDRHQGPDLVAALKKTIGIAAVHLLVEQGDEDVA